MKNKVRGPLSSEELAQKRFARYVRQNRYNLVLSAKTMRVLGQARDGKARCGIYGAICDRMLKRGFIDDDRGFWRPTDYGQLICRLISVAKYNLRSDAEIDSLDEADVMRMSPLERARLDAGGEPFELRLGITEINIFKHEMWRRPRALDSNTRVAMRKLRDDKGLLKKVNGKLLLSKSGRIMNEILELLGYYR